MEFAIDLLESKLKEEKEFINFALRHRDKELAKNKLLNSIAKARSYKNALKVIK